MCVCALSSIDDDDDDDDFFCFLLAGWTQKRRRRWRLSCVCDCAPRAYIRRKTISQSIFLSAACCLFALCWPPPPSSSQATTLPPLFILFVSSRHICCIQNVCVRALSFLCMYVGIYVGSIWWMCGKQNYDKKNDVPTEKKSYAHIRRGLHGGKLYLNIMTGWLCLSFWVILFLRMQRGGPLSNCQIQISIDHPKI